MKKFEKTSNRNNFNGPTNFYGTTQIAAGDIINNTSGIHPKNANYTPEPIWRSPFTMGVLSWISFAIAIGEFFSIGKIIKYALDVFGGVSKVSSGFENQSYLIIFAILTFLLITFIMLRRIVKNQTRHPLLFNFAISGYGKRLILEKIHIDKCPQCGGNMKYYNKPVEWIDKHYSDGITKREITKRTPALECERNSEHWYRVDPAEDKVE